MKHYRHSAFTLLEIVLAITFLAMLMTAVYAIWTAGLSGWKRSATIMESLQRERVVMETLTQLTQSAIFFTSKDSLYQVLGTREPQTGDSISFVTASDLLLPQTEAMVGAMRRVTISMSRDDRGRPFLGIVNAPVLLADKSPESVTHILSAEVCGFAVRYRDPRSVSWVNEWEDATLIPSAIEYTVAFGSNDGRTPPVVVTRSIELYAARYAMQVAGQGNISQQETTNTVNRRDIDLVKPSATSGGDIPGAE